MIYAIGKCFCACVNENGKEKGERKFVSERKWVLNRGVFSQEKKKGKRKRTLVLQPEIFISKYEVNTEWEERKFQSERKRKIYLDAVTLKLYV